MDALSNPELWKIDPERSTLTFRLRHTLLREISGEFCCWGGQVRVARDDPARLSVRIWVDLSSIDTGSEQRNDYILGTELFDVHWEPGLVFDSERLEMDASGHAVVVGWLTLHSYRKEIQVSIDEVSPRTDYLDGPRFVATARASVDRSALGLRRRRGVGDWLSDRLVGETIEITAHIEAASEPNGPSRAPASPS